MNTLAILTLMLFATTVLGQQNYYAKEKEILDKILDKNIYDRRIGPHSNLSTSSSSGPAIVRTNLYIRNIEYVSTANMEWKTQITFRQQWSDSRLAFDDMNGKIRFLVLRDYNQIWIPDTFFSNDKYTESHQQLMPNVLLRIYPNGNVLFSTRLTTTLACPMDLRYYPFDTQTCYLQMASYGYTTDDIVYLWKEGDPVQVTKNLALHDFVLEKFQTNYCTARTNTGEYSCMKLELQFKRQGVKYLFQWFVPTGALTLLSFVSFLMNPLRSARLKFLLATLTALYIHIVVINKWSDVSIMTYHSSKDWWFCSCFHFVLAAIIEFGIVRLCAMRAGKRDGNIAIANENGDTMPLKQRLSDGSRGWQNRIKRRFHWLDILSVIAFPLMFKAYVAYFYVQLNKVEE